MLGGYEQLLHQLPAAYAWRNNLSYPAASRPLLHLCCKTKYSHTLRSKRKDNHRDGHRAPARQRACLNDVMAFVCFL